jgi:hypothetical protein
MLLLAALPLQWFLVVGNLRLHLVAMLVFLALVGVTHRLRTVAPVFEVTAVFVLANAALCVIWLATNAYHGLGYRQPLQQAVYLAVFLAVATVVLRGAPVDRWVETLRWAALAVCTTLTVALSLSMALNDVNPVAVFAQTIATADPQVLQRELFRTAFTGFGINENVVRGNIRHEIFGAVLVGMTVSATCTAIRPFGSRAAHRLYLASMGLGVLLVLVSMSRSLMIATAIWPLLLLARTVSSLRITPRLVGGLLLSTVGIVLLAVSGGLTVLRVRFTEDTGSYEARDSLLDKAFANIGSHAVTGGVATAGESSHNFVLDTWLRAGVFAAAAAVVVVVVLLGLFLSLAATLHREPDWMLPVTAMLALPLVRLFTAGGGLIPPVSWVGLGVAAGFLTWRHATRRRGGTGHLRRPADAWP